MKIICSLLLLLLFFSCTKKPNESTNQTQSASTNNLNIYCWSNYFSPDFIKTFEEKTKSKVVFNYFSSNEELLAKLQAGASGYDIIVPTGYILKPLKELNLIQPLGKLDWPELNNLSDRFKSPKHDPHHEFAIPYQSGTTGLAVNKLKIKSKVDSLSWLYAHPELKGQIAMLDDAPTVIGITLKYLGYSYNENSDVAFNKVKETLLKQKPLLKMYSADPMSLLESGDVAITQAYSGDVLQNKRKNNNFDYIFPKEGGEFYLDYLAIPKGAPNLTLAKEFIRMSLDVKSATAQMMHLFYTPAVNLNGIKGIENLLNNPIIFPSESLLKKYEMLDDNPERLEKINHLWLELKSS